MALRKQIRLVVEDVKHPVGRIFSLFIQFLILVSLVAFSLDTLPDLTQAQRATLANVEIFSVPVFTLEYMARVYAVEKRVKYLFSFYGIIDLLAILPFYLFSGVDLTTARALRFVRLFRVLKLLRYNKAIDRFHRALIIAKEEIILFGFFSIILLYLSSVGIYYFENEAQPEHFKSIFHSLWWSVTTLTTVGYGDMYPITAGGKLFTFFVLMIGLGVVAIPAGLVASALTKAREVEEREDK